MVIEKTNTRTYMEIRYTHTYSRRNANSSYRLPVFSLFFFCKYRLRGTCHRQKIQGAPSKYGVLLWWYGIIGGTGAHSTACSSQGTACTAHTARTAQSTQHTGHSIQQQQRSYAEFYRIQSRGNICEISKVHGSSVLGSRLIILFPSNKKNNSFRRQRFFFRDFYMVRKKTGKIFEE